MRILMVLALGLSLFAAAPAMAQDADAARRLALAAQYIELSQGPNLRKTVQGHFEEAFAKTEMPAEQRAWLTENTTEVFDTAMEATFADMTDDVAEIYTLEELEALIAFHDTPLGRSISAKSFEMGIRMQTVMMPHMTAALTQLGEKYCARFGCAATEGGDAPEADRLNRPNADGLTHCRGRGSDRTGFRGRFVDAGLVPDTAAEGG